MALVVSGPPALAGDLALFHTTDPLLANSPVLVFHGPAAKIGAATSRIQVHVFTPAGIGSYSRLGVSPNSPFYSAVSNLPREEQGDETLRGLAFGLKKYFLELPTTLKATWKAQVKAPLVASIFGDDHIAILASRMKRIQNVNDVIGTISRAFVEQRQAWQDLDVVLPPGTIKEPPRRDSNNSDEFTEADLVRHRYGRYAELVESLGDVAFIPTSRMKREPSKASSVGRSASFLKHQKESARRELQELLETEESYVERVQELHTISNKMGVELKPTSREQLRKVFPTSIATILDLNSTFLESLRTVINATESSAQQDLDMTLNDQINPYQSRQDLMADKQGIIAVAKCLCDWLPQFAESYGQYFCVQAESAQLLKSLFRGPESVLLSELQEIGEQKLTSLLIEPVQRLPRYALYIDGITKQLPVRHPAIKHLMKARDVITEICAQDDATSETIKILEKLRSRVSAWPLDATISGRLISASDFVELHPPYLLNQTEGQQGVLLLFSDCIVLLEKDTSTNISAKALMTELESNLPPIVPEQLPSQALHFMEQIPLDILDSTYSSDLRVLNLFVRPVINTSPEQSSLSVPYSHWSLRLEAPYDSKVERLTEEITKAKIEGRFSERERDSFKWETRCTNLAANHTNLLTAIYDDSVGNHISSRTGCALTRVVVDVDRHSNRPRAGEKGVRTVVALSPQRDGSWRMTIDTIDGAPSREVFAAPDLAKLLRTKLEALLVPRFTMEDPSISACLLDRNAEILQSIELHAAPDMPSPARRQPETHEAERIRRPKSPVKLLSNFLSSSIGPNSQPSVSIKKDMPVLAPPSQQSRLPLPGNGSKPPSREERPKSKENARPVSICVTSAEPGDAISRLEETFSTYLVALQARKGNIVGKNLKHRATADELAVNELYNSVIEDPTMMVLAAQATVDVLFAAFDKFLNVAWKEQVGQVLPHKLLLQIQSNAETLFPTDFDGYFATALRSLPPQNQRAFKSIMKLLADLLDGTGNDSDRGMLTAAFAEVLVTEGDSRDYIPLIDRFVDDTETYFGEPLEEVHKTAEDSSTKRNQSLNASSIGSNASSLRKKFGFGSLSRENSRNEQESRVASVWRTLSKSTKIDAPSPTGSISKGTMLQRSNSTHLDRTMAERPISQDGSVIIRSPPSLSDESPFNSPQSGSGHNQSLSTIGEHPSFIPKGPPRKKRRSSLSDLKALDAALKNEHASPPPMRRSPFLPKGWEDKSLPDSPMSSTPSSKPGSGRFASPTREPARSKLPASFRRDQSPHANKTLGAADKAAETMGANPKDVVITHRPASGIPTLAPLKPVSPLKINSPSPTRTGLSERPGAENIVKKPGSPTEKHARPTSSGGNKPDAGPIRKLRMQSPQKLRERLQNEQSTFSATQSSLQDELAKLGDEFSATPSRLNSVRKNTPSTGRLLAAASSAPTSFTAHPTTDFAQRLQALEVLLPSRLDALNGDLSTLRVDFTNALTISETKCKNLDALYREANGENEALYARFNSELARVLKTVRGSDSDGVEELKRQLKESQDMVAGLKRETARLKRENVGLRAQLRD
ncbi:Hypothetical protein R9X50_00737100 [Acrodontium crateriforme]|uniref:DH domain-containing protein n=1 Tax=Acrodontium crateriforme TaxID=150365 RepID=A0AAQ3MB07_9PEZI|nr:Hypothetical protein R9X50_00737100 [Acrodontium crateriforme]